MRLSRDGIAGLICLAGSLLLLYASRGLPQPALVPIGPAFYPRILLTTTAVLSGLLVVTDLLARRRAKAPPAQYRLVVLTFAIFAAYVAALAPLGYRLSTLLFVIALQVALDPPQSGRRWTVVLVVTVATTAVTYYVFEGYLSVLLPRGRLSGF